MSIKKPQKAPSDPITNEQLHLLNYPIVGSPKLDGFRCTVDDTPLTSSMKLFPNIFLNEVLSDPMYKGLDGEILVGKPNDPDAFHNTSGPIRRINGEPDFNFFVFDNWIDGHHTYEQRWFKEKSYYTELPRVMVLEQKLLKSPDEVLAYELEMLSQGYEGAMIRSLHSLYKEGRCSFRDLNIFKRKPFVECEAIVVGFIEGLQNLNESHMDEMGRNVRSSHKANKVPKGTLGSFVLRSKLWKKDFTAGFGEGYDMSHKQYVWNHRQEFLGLTVTIKYQKYGSREAPRIPNVIKIRPLWDL